MVVRIMKLYEIPRESKIKGLQVNKPDGTLLGDVIIFHRTDGMYSYCTVEGTDQVVHLSVMTPLKKVGEYYEIDETDTPKD